MKNLIFIIVIVVLTSCKFDKTVKNNTDRLYYLSNCSYDTTFIEKPSFDTSNLSIISIKTFISDRRFTGKVVKYTNEPAPIDGGEVCYLTPDLGIIYRKSTAWPCYIRLHSTNDSIEKRINQYIENILSRTDLVIEGDIQLEYDKEEPPIFK